MAASKKIFYIVVNGRQPGLYDQWHGEGGAKEQIEDLPEALYKGFITRQEAIHWLNEVGAVHLIEQLGLHEDKPIVFQHTQNPATALAAGHIVIFAVGTAVGVSGPGAYSVVLRYKEHRKEFSGGYRRTTVIRMELLACLLAIQTLKSHDRVHLYTNSPTVVDALTRGQLQRWSENGWYQSANRRLDNVDLWIQLQRNTQGHNLSVALIEHHPEDKTGQHCWELAQTVLQQANLPPDTAYEGGYTKLLSPTLAKES